MLNGENWSRAGYTQMLNREILSRGVARADAYLKNLIASGAHADVKWKNYIANGAHPDA